MAEEHGGEELIKCSCCKCFYFERFYELNRLGKRYKTCNKCRAKKAGHKVNSSKSSCSTQTDDITQLLKTVPDDLINKIIMMAIPEYPFLNELKTTRFVRTHCDCEGCTEKHYYGCYYFREFNYRLKPTKQVLELWSVFGFGLTDDRCSYLFKDLKG